MDSEKVMVTGWVGYDIIPGVVHDGAREHRGTPLLRPGGTTEIGDYEGVGGGILNIAGAISAMGSESRLHVIPCGCIGGDQRGREILEWMESRRMPHCGIRVLSDARTGFNIVLTLSKERQYFYCVGASAQLQFDYIPASVLQTCGTFVCGLTTWTGLFRNDAAELLRLLKYGRVQGAATVLDLAVLDPRSSLAAQDGLAIVRKVLPHTSLYCPSAKEHFMLTRWAPQGPPGRLTKEEIASECVRCVEEFGAGATLIRAGSMGMCLYVGQQGLQVGHHRKADFGEWRGGPPRWLEIPPMDIMEVSAVGLGDACVGTFVAALLSNDVQTVADSLRVAAVAATLCLGSLDGLTWSDTVSLSVLSKKAHEHERWQPLPV